jgi:hypothetical protein
VCLRNVSRVQRCLSWRFRCYLPAMRGTATPRRRTLTSGQEEREKCSCSCGCAAVLARIRLCYRGCNRAAAVGYDPRAAGEEAHILAIVPTRLRGGAVQSSNARASSTCHKDSLETGGGARRRPGSTLGLLSSAAPLARQCGELIPRLRTIWSEGRLSVVWCLWAMERF